MNFKCNTPIMQTKTTPYYNVAKWLSLPYKWEVENERDKITVNIVITNPDGDELMIFSNTVARCEMKDICKEADIDIEFFMYMGEDGLEFDGSSSDVKDILDDHPEAAPHIPGLWDVLLLEE